MLFLEIPGSGSDDRTLLIALAISVITVLVAVVTKLYIDQRKDRKEYIDSLKAISDSIENGIASHNASIKEVITNSQTQLNLTINNTLTKFDASIERANQLTNKLLEKL